MIRFAPLFMLFSLIGCATGGYQGKSDKVDTFNIRDLDVRGPVTGPNAERLIETVRPILSTDPTVLSAYFVFAVGREEDGERATLVLIATGEVDETQLVDKIVEPTSFAREGGGFVIVFLGLGRENEFASVAEPFYTR